MTAPSVRFTDERLANGLRLIISEDHLAPVVAVNIWYDVGSKHEVAGKTGFAHLFEHVMFQGSRPRRQDRAHGPGPGRRRHAERHHLPGPDQLLRDGPEPPARAGALARGGPDGHAPRRAQPGEPGQPARRGQEREALRATTTGPTATWFHKLQEHLFPPEHPYHHPTIGSMEDLDAASLEDVAAFFRTYYAPNNAVLSIVGDVDPAQARAWVERYFGEIPANPAIPLAGDMSLPPTLGAEVARGRRGPRPAAAPLLRLPGAGASATAASTRSRSPSQILAGGKGSRLYRRLVREERIAQDVVVLLLGLVGGASIVAGQATVRPGVDPAVVEARLRGGARAPRPGAGHRRRAGPGAGPDRDVRARGAPAGRRAGRPAVACTRRCSTTRT